MVGGNVDHIHIHGRDLYSAAIGRVEEMVWLPYDAGLSAAAETLVVILKRVIVSLAVYPRFYPSSRGLSAIAELLVYWHHRRKK